MISRLLFAFALLFSTTVWAQTGVEPESETAEQSDEAQVQAEGDTASDAEVSAPVPSGPRIDEIVVTAQKRAQNVQDVPIAVAAFSGDALEQSGVKTMNDLAFKTPGLIYDTLVNYAIIYVRGVGTDAFIPSADLSVAPYIDGVYFPITFGLARSLGEVERVEVLKGPQGTLFGRNSTGGAINIVTREPSDTFSAKASTSYGKLHENNNRIYLSGPVTDWLKVSVAGIYNTRDDYYEPVDGLDYDELQPYRERGVTGKIRVEPFDWLEATLTGYYVDTEGVGTSLLACLKPSVLTAALGVSCAPDYKANTNLDNTAFSETWAGTLTVIARPGPFDIKSITAYQETNGQSLVDFDGSKVNLIEFGGDGTKPENRPALFGEIFTQEVQLISNADTPWSDWLEWIAGFYYLDSTVGYDPVGFAVAGLNNGLSGLTGGSLPLPLNIGLVNDLLDVVGGLLAPLDPLLQATVLVRGSLDTSSYAGFAQATIRPLDWLEVTLGGRYQYEERTVYNATLSARTTVLGSTGEIPLLTYNPKSIEESNFSPKVSVAVRPVEDVMVYASYQQAFKSGSFNIINLTQAPTLIRPETVTAWELGVKSQFWDRRVQVNAAIFKTRIDDLQSQFVSLLSGGVVQFQNAEEARIKGADIDVQFAALEGLMLTAGASYLDGHYESFTGANGYTEGTGNQSGFYSQNQNFSGNTIVRNPKWTASFGANYSMEVPGGLLNLGADYYYNSGYWFDAQNSLEQPSYTLLNARVGYTYENWGLTLTVYGANLQNTRYYLYQFQTDLGIVGKLAQTRTYGFRLNWKFGE